MVLCSGSIFENGECRLRGGVDGVDACTVWVVGGKRVGGGVVATLWWSVGVFVFKR